MALNGPVGSPPTVMPRSRSRARAMVNALHPPAAHQRADDTLLAAEGAAGQVAGIAISGNRVAARAGASTEPRATASEAIAYRLSEKADTPEHARRTDRRAWQDAAQ